MFGAVGVAPSDVVQEGVFQRYQIVGVLPHHDGRVDDLEGNDAGDLRGGRAPQEDGNGGLPCFWVGLYLLKEVDGLLLEGLVGSVVACDRDGIFYLETGEDWSAFGFASGRERARNGRSDGKGA